MPRPYADAFMRLMSLSLLKKTILRQVVLFSQQDRRLIFFYICPYRIVSFTCVDVLILFSALVLSAKEGEIDIRYTTKIPKPDTCAVKGASRDSTTCWLAPSTRLTNYVSSICQSRWQGQCRSSTLVIGSGPNACEIFPTDCKAFFSRLIGW